MRRWTRFVRFNAVGAAGIAVQLGTLWLLTAVAHVHYVPATAAAVSLAVAHNFLWHRRWTWGDRQAGCGAAASFVRFAAANGAISLVGSLALTTALVSVMGIRPVAANAAAIVIAGVLNFHVGDTIVFRREARSRCAGRAR